jgi:hypothetical protein
MSAGYPLVYAPNGHIAVLVTAADGVVRDRIIFDAPRRVRDLA